MKYDFSQLVHESKELLINNPKESIFEEILKKIVIFNDSKEFEDYCYAEYGEYKTLCIENLLEIAKIEYLLLIDRKNIAQNVTADKIDNLKDLISTLDILTN